jgi:hypothetical protein
LVEVIGLLAEELRKALPFYDRDVDKQGLDEYPRSPG